jgi:hypothetical protein
MQTQKILPGNVTRAILAGDNKETRRLGQRGGQSRARNLRAKKFIEKFVPQTPFFPVQLELVNLSPYSD